MPAVSHPYTKRKQQARGLSTFAAISASAPGINRISYYYLTRKLYSVIITKQDSGFVFRSLYSTENT